MPSDRGALTTAPAWRLAELIRRREVSPVEVLDAHVARLDAVEPHLNAVVAERLDDARREAHAAEARARVSADPASLPPLLGVPCTIKDFLAVRGLPWTAGLHARAAVRADDDAAVVTRLRAAGAIIVAKTNVPEGGMWMETSNPLHGRTRNPWDPARTPGGSSGGEAALVAAGASPLGLGSDIAGSIRIPAGMCGVIGHKPTELLVPNTGHWGASTGEAERMLCTGPLTRCVRDAELVLELIAGPDGASRTTRTLAPREPALDAGDLRGVTVVPLLATGRIRIAPVMRAAVARSRPAARPAATSTPRPGSGCSAAASRPGWARWPAPAPPTPTTSPPARRARSPTC
ncbi:MAG: amidase [Kofleriaceae bacterium]|nr:amidase [Kofleriaceae bacterium]